MQVLAFVRDESSKGRVCPNSDPQVVEESLTTQRVAQKLQGGFDGLKVDVNGNVWTTGPGGILIISPDGKHLGTNVPGDVVANCGFGDDGSTLYMTVNHQLMRVRTKTKGLGF